MNLPKQEKQYLPIIVVLRGLAALAVCMFHFTKEFVNEDGLVRAVFRNGWMGVEVFFVISGFVIPFSLLGTSFRFYHYFKFMKKRFIRIEPAYLISVVLVVILSYAASQTPGFAGEPFKMSIGLLIQHILYLVEFFNNTWLNPVYWTLEVEFHFYLIIGLLIALWNLKKRWLTIASIIGLFSVSFINQDVITFFKYTDIFVLGILTAFYKKEQLGLKPYIASLLIVSFVVYDSHGIIISLLTLATATLISFASSYGNVKSLIFLGNISYSLYLLHVPIGVKIVNLSKRLDLNETSKYGVILVALSFSIFAAWLFYKYIEKPSHQWAKKVKFN
ncbi:acyltransferase family protein [Psychroserpens luteus]|uniref:Acyltransferase family protein n=1 Tax=Psychroserpens luteus TaxID=1434066 RepID=A0ABW5ZWN0_9FLAO|nr:acyltransferase [Psychroserpens luteus]